MQMKRSLTYKLVVRELLALDIPNGPFGLRGEGGRVLYSPQSKQKRTIKDLVRLKILSNLSINTSNNAFPTEEGLKALMNLKKP